MADGNFVSEIIEEQNNTRADIRALKSEISHLRTELGENTKLLQQVTRFQAAQDAREAIQTDIAQNVTLIAHSNTKQNDALTEANKELTMHLKELRMSTSVDASLGRMITKMGGLELVLDEQAKDKESE